MIQNNYLSPNNYYKAKIMSATVYCIVLVFNFFFGRPLIYD